jgi:hypothetical protein
MGILVHETHIPNLIESGFPGVGGGIIGLALDIDNGDVVASYSKDADALAQPALGAILAVVIEKDGMAEKL